MANLAQIVELADRHEGFVLGSLTFLYLLTTIGLFIAARRANRLALRNVETLTQLEEERLRPVVICELLTETPFVMLRIQNLGQTTAKDVTVSITPPLRMLFGGDNAQPKEKSEKTIGFLEHGFRSLAPRQQVSTIVGSFQRMREAYPHLVFECAMTYGSSSTARTYSYNVHLDLRYALDATHISRKTLHDIGKELEEIRKEMGHIATGFHKPQIIVQDIKENRAEDEEFVRQIQEKKKETA